jgi:hypothetical protein
MLRALKEVEPINPNKIVFHLFCDFLYALMATQQAKKLGVL